VPGRVAALLAVVAALAVPASQAAAPPYTVAATRACLLRLARSVAGLPPATPPVPAALFVYAPARLPTAWGIWPSSRSPRAQLGVWTGSGSYEGAILSFFDSAASARAAREALGQGEVERDVVVSSDQAALRAGVRKAVLGCLSSGPAREVPVHPARRASLATFAGRWGGHTRGLSITAAGRGRESASDGCCDRAYDLAFRILAVRGTLTRASATYRVVSFRRYHGYVHVLRVGEVGRLALDDGIVTNALTDDFFCSNPAWGATGACGL
jgi:hypothetical protein